MSEIEEELKKRFTEQIETAQPVLDKLEVEIQRLKIVGGDTTELESKLKRNRDLIETIRKTYNL